MLKPEHVERISDTEVRITLPPCPDFDIDEDEIVHITIPPSMLANSTAPVYAGSFTIHADTYEERIDNAIKGCKEELSLLSDDAVVSRFLIEFFTCEIVAKSIVSKYSHKGTGKKSLVGKWSTKDANSAIEKLGIEFDESAVRLLFSEEKAVASEMSARKLRDNICHRMKSVHRKAVQRRYDSLTGSMAEFLAAVEIWRRNNA